MTTRTAPPVPAVADAPVRAERSDVRRNRAALLAAGRELLARNPNVALYEVAKLAGVGQATLYRHFPDRAALAIALADQTFDEIFDDIAGIDPESPDALYRTVQRICAGSVGSMDLYPLLHHSPDDHVDIDQLRSRLSDVLAVPLRGAKRQGAVRATTTMDDILLLIRMVTSTIRATVEEPIEQTRTHACERALTLAWNGLAQASA